MMRILLGRQRLITSYSSLMLISSPTTCSQARLRECSGSLPLWDDDGQAPFVLSGVVRAFDLVPPSGVHFDQHAPP